VLRPSSVHQARCQLEQVLAAGLVHVELAVSPTPAWVAMVHELIAAFPALRLGAASVCSSEQLVAVEAAGLAYAVSPILDPLLLLQAQALGLTLVPGVFTPTEIAMAVRAGAPAVKLFPAAALGSAYWRSLAGPLGPLPFCIAAGGLNAADVPAWLAAGVDAVALGNSLFVDAPAAGADGGSTPLLKPDLAPLLARLADLGDRQQLST
jgi:2-dehydro-3-deoxyphosphogluconate aldolase/(4S)-4-hydroxy-2-oxoglutarate aldolase